MKIKRLKSLLYIFSSVMVLGLALVSFDATEPVQHTVNLPSAAPTKAGTPTPAPTGTPTPTPTSTPTPTPTPSPTPSLAELNAMIEIIPATTETGVVLANAVTEHLNAYYSNEALQVKEINNITCYYKEGLGSIDYFVYASYDITYVGSNVPIPALDEYLISMDGENIVIATESDEGLVKDALRLSRTSQSVSTLYIQEVIQRYMNAKLACDESLLTAIVTDPSYLNMEHIRTSTMHIMEYRDPSFLIYTVPDDVEDFEYIAYYCADIKISTLATPLPGMDEFKIKLDEQNYPKIFLGKTSPEADLAILTAQQQEDFIQKYTEINKRLDDIIESDSDVREFMERISNATGQ